MSFLENFPLLKTPIFSFLLTDFGAKRNAYERQEKQFNLILFISLQSNYVFKSYSIHLFSSLKI